jgi:hypothetical protein
MLNWFHNKLVSWGSKQQRTEIETWLQMLRAMNSDEIGMLMAGATHFRHILENTYHVNLLEPFEANSIDPELSSKLRKLIQEYQSNGDNTSAACVMVWLHSLRCSALLDVRPLGRELWQELRRGFPFVDDAANSMLRTTRQLLNTDGFDSIPVGLEPERP